MDTKIWNHPWDICQTLARVWSFIITLLRWRIFVLNRHFQPSVFVHKFQRSHNVDSKGCYVVLLYNLMVLDGMFSYQRVHFTHSIYIYIYVTTIWPYACIYMVTLYNSIYIRTVYQTLLTLLSRWWSRSMCSPWTVSCCAVWRSNLVVLGDSWRKLSRKPLSGWIWFVPRLWFLVSIPSSTTRLGARAADYNHWTDVRLLDLLGKISWGSTMWGMVANLMKLSFVRALSWEKLVQYRSI